MANYIDRRLNPKDKSLGNRQRFLRRARDELKRTINEQIRSGKISDVDAEHSVPLPAKGTGEPTFQHAPSTGRRDHVLPGNKEFRSGDRIPRPVMGGGSGGKNAAASGDFEDDFRFVLSREEVLDLFFEDLELPDLVKLNLKEVSSFKPRRAGFAITGAPTNINVGRTMRMSYGRRIALRRPKRAEVERLTGELAALEACRSGSQDIGAAGGGARGIAADQPAAQDHPLCRPGRHPLQPLRAAAAAQRQCGDVLPDGRLRLDGGAREGPRQALLRAPASVPGAALRAHRRRLHPPYP